jgi:hypothetical protein
MYQDILAIHRMAKFGEENTEAKSRLGQLAVSVLSTVR